MSYDTPGNYSGACAAIAKMLTAITNAGATPVCLTYDNTRWGASAIKGTSTPIQAWSSSGMGAVTWDAQGVNSSGTFVDTDVYMNWATANTACATAGGRLPTLEELKTLIDATFIASAGATRTPPGFVALTYWSSTPVPLYSTTRAYLVNVSNGGISNSVAMTYDGTYVRCVR